jgi:hypothetical protein
LSHFSRTTAFAIAGLRQKKISSRSSLIACRKAR